MRMRSALMIVVAAGALAPFAALSQTGSGPGGGAPPKSASQPSASQPSSSQPSSSQPATSQPPATGSMPKPGVESGGGSLAASRSDLGAIPRISARTFNEMDKNGDGFLSKDEAKGAMSTYFNDLDKNGDGKLSPSEVVSGQ